MALEQKGIPLLGGVISGGMTNAAFHAGAVRLKGCLHKLPQAHCVGDPRQGRCLKYTAEEERHGVRGPHPHMLGDSVQAQRGHVVGRLTDRDRTMWVLGYYASTVGPSESILRRYILCQVDGSKIE